MSNQSTPSFTKAIGAPRSMDSAQLHLENVAAPKQLATTTNTTQPSTQGGPAFAYGGI